MTSLFKDILTVSGVCYSILLMLAFAGLFFPDRRKKKNRIFVSVVVAARNEEGNLPILLQDLDVQSYPRELYEIIIVDDQSTDRTREIAEKFSLEHSSFRCVPVVRKVEGLTAKKNAIHTGIMESKGEVLLTTDADCRVKPGWIEGMLSCFTPEVGMVVGFSQLGESAEGMGLFQKLQAVDFLMLMGAAQGFLNLGWPLAASGQNLAYRRKAFDEVGGFSRIGHRISGDDVLLLQLVSRKTSWNIRFSFSEETFNTSLPEKDFHDFLNQRKRWASNGAYQLKLNPYFFVLVLATFFVNVSLLLLFIQGFFSGHSPFLYTGLLAKAIVEGLLFLKTTRVYKRRDLLSAFPLWFVLQIPYVMIVGVLGNIGRFSWKGRVHAPAERKAG